MDERRKFDRRLNQKDYLMTDGMVANMAEVSPNTVRYWRQMGVLPFVRVGKYPRIWFSTFCKVFRKPDKISPSVTGAGEAYYGTTQR